MKILFISDVYFPRVNGVSTSIRTFVSQMQALGHEVHLIAPDYGVATEDEAWIKRIPARNIYFDPEDRLMRYGVVLKLLPELREENYDVVHIHTPFVAHYLGIKLSRLLDIPCLETYHTFFEDYMHHYLPWIPRSMARRIAINTSRRQCNAVNAIIAPSQPMLDALRSYGVKTSAEVIPTGLQEKSFEEADGEVFRDRYGISRQRPVALFVGRVAHEKNIDFLLRMANELRRQQPDMLLVVAGEGPAQKHLQALSAELALGDNIKFIGYLDRNTELNACYKAADVFVFASKTETQGLVLLEAMAQGVPVVALAELGTKSILIEGEGAMIAPEDERIFASKVFSLFANPGKRAKLGQAARQYAVKRWTARLQAERMLQFYQRVQSRSAFHAMNMDNNLKARGG
ncbi:glycosyltransferase [Methylobacillus sp. Pita1]|uniref:glycosyltransferase n=1 Tax=Methylobacillus sp. Pita1 TaxID=3382642 RepID=UPI0038B4E59A